jgi:hypothetical protein
MSVAEQVSFFGSADEAFEPPDTQVAAGPGAVAEATNDSLSVWSKTGNLTAADDLNVFFSVPAGQFFTDPRLLYDAQSGHWLLSGWSTNDASTDTDTYLAISSTSDPTGNWVTYTIASSSTGGITDQPMTGVCNDKVVVAWNSYTVSGTTATYNGAVAEVFDKQALLGTGSVSETSLVSTSQFRFVPAQALSSSTTCYLAVNDADATVLGSNTTTPTLGVYSITGTNAAADVTFSETNLPIAATSPPPDPRQPSGVTNDTLNDDRMISAVWQNNELWTSLTDACTPTGDTTTRDCMRLDEVSTSGTTPTLTLDTDISTAGLDEYYPAVSLDAAGDLFVAYTASSATLDPGAYAAISASTSIGTFSAPITIAAGSASYSDGSPSSANTARWGDYSAAAPDPSVPGAVWVAGEYAPSDAGLGDWGTAAALVSLTAPPAAETAVAAEGSDGQMWVQAPQLPAGPRSWRLLPLTAARRLRRCSSRPAATVSCSSGR